MKKGSDPFSSLQYRVEANGVAAEFEGFDASRKILFDAKSQRWEYLLTRQDFRATQDLLDQVSRQIRAARAHGYQVEIRCETEGMKQSMVDLFRAKGVSPVRVVGPNGN